MNNITYRTNFLQSNTLDGRVEKDLGSLSFGDYDFGDVQWYRCVKEDVGRPDRISKVLYGTTNFWWFICWFNGISDVWNDIRENMIIKFPNVDAIREGMRSHLRSE